MDVQKQINYWRTGAEEDFSVAEILLEKSKIRHALFFAHLALEKVLKAHVTKATHAVPPKIHDLGPLAQRAALVLPPARESFLSRFDVFQMEWRYPDQSKPAVGQGEANHLLVAAKETLQWLTQQL